MKKLIILALAVISAFVCIFGISGCKIKQPNDNSDSSSLKATSLGIGGGGLLKLEGLESLR